MGDREGESDGLVVGACEGDVDGVKVGALEGVDVICCVVGDGTGN